MTVAGQAQWARLARVARLDLPCYIISTALYNCLSLDDLQEGIYSYVEAAQGDDSNRIPSLVILQPSHRPTSGSIV
jgi:hypothetical protein